MNVEIRTEAAQFPEKEYINGIFLAVKNKVGRYHKVRWRRKAGHCMQTHCNENSKQIFPKMKQHSLVPNFHIPVSVSNLYLTTIERFIYFHDRSGINCSQVHECGNWEQGRAVSFLGIHKSDLVCSVGRDSYI
jgi:hypothetical protein